MIASHHLLLLLFFFQSLADDCDIDSESELGMFERHCLNFSNVGLRWLTKLKVFQGGSKQGL